ncbi:hypothetical protein Harreka1_30 [Olleya phage Harreka_1]|uniref:Uncharacterized protein n=1 Tax=Olleya phage Harreka_1 TaxID=2745673 RepID=A0A8E4ZLR1_9CAUD|nr:hypothetical protein M1M26_gp30 [Olleya phage Harreka_1]QQV90437.1 hypothetical protein Harreka1_30 [Olleya phage Harreka_1]
MKFFDKKGNEIKKNDVIYNPHNEPKEMKIVEINNNLSFEDGTLLSYKHQTNTFWEVIPKELNNEIQELRHHKSTTVGLWATDRPGLINKQDRKLLFEI